MYEKILNALNTADVSMQKLKTFYADHELKLDDLNIDIHGYGSLTFPLNTKEIEQLIAIASQAKFGLRDKTLLDTSVRDTNEIYEKNIIINFNEAALSNMLTSIRNTLGLSKNTKLVPHLHNLLIYGAGQFFKPHQDSEKLPGMIASLVIVLPSPHIGGQLDIYHNDTKHNFSSENLDSQKFQCVAFYSDCKHEVLQVKQGYRVALTFNLVLEANSTPSVNDANIALEEALIDYFDINSNVKSNAPLIYFLNHEYTEHSLKWEMLKGVDYDNATAFKNASEKLNLIPHLALAVHHESWNTDGDEDDPNIEELIDDSTTISFWLDKNNRKLPYKGYQISEEDEVCCSIPTKDFEPYETEFEGYMGNYGNTADYWYRRAAVVLWNTSSQTFMEFTLNYEEALNHLIKLIQRKEDIQKIVSIIKDADHQFQKKSWSLNAHDFKIFTQIAVYVSNPDLAYTILECFTCKSIEQKGLEQFAGLQLQYGIDWCLNLLSRLQNPDQNRYSDSLMYEDIDILMQRLLHLGIDVKLLSVLMSNQVNSIIKSDSDCKNYSAAALLKCIPRKLALSESYLKACITVSNATMLEQLVKHLINNPIVYPEINIIELLLQLRELLQSKYMSAYNLLHEHAAKYLAKELKNDIRHKDDYSIAIKLSCKCADCKTAEDFMHSKTESSKIWPIATDRRNHIIHQFSDHVLPVTLTVKEQGSPYKLVMIKSDKLYAMELERHNKIKLYAIKLDVLKNHI